MRDNNLMTTAAGNRGWCWGFILAFARVSCLGTGGFWAFTACFYVFLIFQAIIPPAKVAPARGCCPSLGTMHGAVSHMRAAGDAGGTFRGNFNELNGFGGETIFDLFEFF